MQHFTIANTATCGALKVPVADTHCGLRAIDGEAGYQTASRPTPIATESYPLRAPNGT